MNGPSSASAAFCRNCNGPAGLPVHALAGDNLGRAVIVDLGLGVLKELELAGKVQLLGLVVKLGLKAFVAQHEAIRPHRLAPGFLDVIERANLADDPAAVEDVQALGAALVDLVL
jgi:hypothetical protein